MKYENLSENPYGVAAAVEEDGLVTVDINDPDGVVAWVEWKSDTEERLLDIPPHRGEIRLGFPVEEFTTATVRVDNMDMDVGGRGAVVLN